MTIQGNPNLPSEQNESAERKFAEPREVLLAARKLIEKPENFSQFEFARDRQGQPCLRTSTRAFAFCAYGALDRLRFGGHSTRELQTEAEVALCSAMGGAIGDFNDNHTHAEVLAAFDRAIAQCAVGDREGVPTTAAGA